MKNLSFEEILFINGGSATDEHAFAKDVSHAAAMGCAYFVCGCKVVACKASELWHSIVD